MSKSESAKDQKLSTDSVKALFFDVFGTLVDWRRGVAREAESILKPLGFHLDWRAFADAWRDQYQPGMEQVRSGAIPYAKLDVLHLQMLKENSAFVRSGKDRAVRAGSVDPGLA
jgi:FMN phosphatase YigB (HAD superfamily)